MPHTLSLPVMVSLLRKEGITIQRLSYTLLEGYGETNEMRFRKGVETDSLQLKNMQHELIHLRKSAVAYTATAIGEVSVTLSDGTSFQLHPVFHTASDSYRDFLYVGTDVCVLTPGLRQLLETLRKA